MTLTPVDGARATWCEEHQKSITAHHIEETQLKTASNLVSTLYSEHTLWGRSRARFDNENRWFSHNLELVTDATDAADATDATKWCHRLLLGPPLPRAPGARMT